MRKPNNQNASPDARIHLKKKALRTDIEGHFEWEAIPTRGLVLGPERKLSVQIRQVTLKT